MMWRAKCQQCGHEWLLKHPTIRNRPITSDEAFQAMETAVCDKCGHGHVRFQARFTVRNGEDSHVSLEP
jgi:DNA-directed RNA polymerase subunit RPC12/RpoP